MGVGDDRAAFDRLIVEHIPAALRFATRLCGNPTDAEDVVQEALLRSAKGWRSFRGEASIRSWLFRIVINAFRDSLARRMSVPLEVDPPTKPPDALEASEFGRIVAKHVSSLPPRQREVLVLIAFEQMPIEQTAKVLNINQQNVRTNLHLAREAMKRKLSHYLSRNTGNR